MGVKLGLSPLSEIAELRFCENQLTGGLWRRRSEGLLCEYCYGDRKEEEQFDETGRRENMYKIVWSENYKEIKNLEDLGVDGSLILGV